MLRSRPFRGEGFASPARAVPSTPSRPSPRSRVAIGLAGAALLVPAVATAETGWVIVDEAKPGIERSAELPSTEVGHQDPDAGTSLDIQIEDALSEEAKDFGEPVEADGAVRAKGFVGDDGVYHAERGDETREDLLPSPISAEPNPLLTKASVEQIWEEIRMSTDPSEWYRQMAEAKDKIGRQSIDSWYRELAECTSVCAQVVHKIWAKHMEAVTRLPHFYVRYYLGSDKLEPTYVSKLGEIAQYLDQNPAFDVVIVGRASRIGSRALNYDLSRRRAEAVRDQFAADGVSLGRIHTIHLGYEPPQINEFVVEQYRLEDPLVNLGHPIRDQSLASLNQSVIAVLVQQDEPVAVTEPAVGAADAPAEPAAAVSGSEAGADAAVAATP